MNQKTKILGELNKYVRSCQKWELPALRVQCVQMIKMIDSRLYGKSMPIIKVHWWQRLFRRKKK